MSDPADETLLVHATAVAIGRRAVLLRGPPGAGKSDLALRLIDACAELIADDQCELRRLGAEVLVRAPASIAGLLEVRGIGILNFAAVADLPLALVVDLVSADAVERLPEAKTESVLGIEVPLVALAPFEASAPVKVRALFGALPGPAKPASRGG